MLQADSRDDVRNADNVQAVKYRYTIIEQCTNCERITKTCNNYGIYGNAVWALVELPCAECCSIEIFRVSVRGINPPHVEVLG